MGFDDGAEVDVKELEDDTNWELLRSLGYQGKQDHFVVPIKMHTDFASVPRVFVWFLPRYGRYTKAAILHDYLWREKVVDGTLSLLDADALFRRAMRELGVPFLRRWIMWAAVRWGALLKKGGWSGWWKESWRVLLITTLALPIVLPPAAVIVVALLAFYVVELATWAYLKLVEVASIRVRERPPRKQVNLPKPGWKL